MSLPYRHYKRVTQCCGAHEVCGADCLGAWETYCRECDEVTCSKCAGWWEWDERPTGKCLACHPMPRLPRHAWKPWWTGDKCMDCGMVWDAHPEATAERIAAELDSDSAEPLP